MCGCFGQVSMSPFYTGIVSHWRTTHGESLAMLAEAQYVALTAFAAEMASERQSPDKLRVVPQPIRIG